MPPDICHTLELHHIGPLHDYLAAFARKRLHLSRFGKMFEYMCLVARGAVAKGLIHVLQCEGCGTVINVTICLLSTNDPLQWLCPFWKGVDGAERRHM